MNDEIHRYILLWFFRWLKRHDSTKWQVVAGFCDLALGAGACEVEYITFEMGASEVSLNIGVEFVEARVSSKRCFVNFTEKISMEYRVIRDKDTERCFMCNNKIMMESKARMILSITKLLIEGGEAWVCFVGGVERVKEFSVRLRGSLELTELCGGEIVGNSIDMYSETAKCIGDDVCFSCLVFYFEVICLNRENPAYDAIGSGGGQFQRSVYKKLCRRFVIRFDQEFMIQEIRAEVFNRPHNSEKFFFPHRIVTFSGIKCAGNKGNRAFAMVMFLRQDSAKGIIAGISSEDGLTRWIKDGKAIG